jgi:hypothetical protein
MLAFAKINKRNIQKTALLNGWRDSRNPQEHI